MSQLKENLRAQLKENITSLKIGEYTLDFGRCFYCGNIEQTDGESHPYFIEGNFVSKTCYIKLRGIQLESGIPFQKGDRIPVV